MSHLHEDRFYVRQFTSPCGRHPMPGPCDLRHGAAVGVCDLHHPSRKQHVRGMTIFNCEGPQDLSSHLPGSGRKASAPASPRGRESAWANPPRHPSTDTRTRPARSMNETACLNFRAAPIGFATGRQRAPGGPGAGRAGEPGDRGAVRGCRAQHSIRRPLPSRFAHRLLHTPNGMTAPQSPIHEQTWQWRCDLCHRL
jgi:hypothetical protein